jgi:hypothetical protein
VSGQCHTPTALPPGKSPVNHSIGGRVGHRAGLDTWKREKSPSPDGILFRLIQPLAFSLYWLSYPVFFGYSGFLKFSIYFLSLPSELHALSISHTFILSLVVKFDLTNKQSWIILQAQIVPRRKHSSLYLRHLTSSGCLWNSNVLTVLLPSGGGPWNSKRHIVTSLTEFYIGWFQCWASLRN